MWVEGGDGKQVNTKSLAALRRGIVGNSPRAYAANCFRSFINHSDGYEITVRSLSRVNED